jgi:hypothetical protein
VSTPLTGRTLSHVPKSAVLFPTATRTDAVTSSAGVGQRLPWFGTSYSLSWNAVHTDSNSFLNSYNPLLQSGLSLNVSQPLVRDLSMDAARFQVATSHVNRDIADTRLRESIVHTTANVKSAYWALEATIAEARAHAEQGVGQLQRMAEVDVVVGRAVQQHERPFQGGRIGEQRAFVIGAVILGRHAEVTLGVVRVVVLPVGDGSAGDGCPCRPCGGDPDSMAGWNSMSPCR